MTRCDACPCPADVPCYSHAIPRFCEWAVSGDRTRLGHIIERSRIAQGAGLVSSPVMPRSARFDPMDCAWLGEPTGDLVECPTCSGTVRLKVFACQLFETTHVRQCETCTERRPKGEDDHGA